MENAKVGFVSFNSDEPKFFILQDAVLMLVLTVSPEKMTAVTLNRHGFYDGIVTFNVTTDNGGYKKHIMLAKCRPVAGDSCLLSALVSSRWRIPADYQPDIVLEFPDALLPGNFMDTLFINIADEPSGVETPSIVTLDKIPYETSDDEEEPPRHQTRNE
jgi:hypothetical protein